MDTSAGMTPFHEHVNADSMTLNEHFSQDATYSITLTFLFVSDFLKNISF